MIHRSIFIILLGGLLIVGCRSTNVRPAPLALPRPVAADGPAIPFHSPNILGKAETHIRPIADADALLSCLESGQRVYGIALQNSNVRAAPAVDACRIGRIARGSVVEVVGAVKTDELTVTETLSSATTTRVTFTLGYIEDIQPIFRRTCNSCHSAVVQNVGLQVTEYASLMQGGSRGAVVEPGDAEGSSLWQQVSSGKMPLIGELSPAEKTLVHDWIMAGAPERRQMMAETIATPPALQTPEVALWLQVDGDAINPVSDRCEAEAEDADGAGKVVSSDLLYPLSCGIAPREAELQAALRQLAIALPAAPVANRAAASIGAVMGAAAVGGEPEVADAAPAAVAPAAPGRTIDPRQAGIQASAFNLAPASDADGWLRGRGGFCVDQRLPQNERGITALAFAPDGRLFIAFDQSLTDNPDPLILFDAHHPSRSIAVYDPVADTRPVEIFGESSRITDMTYYGGALYLNRAGEVGRIPEGGRYEVLAGGFAVNSQLFHANNGIAIVDGWLYVSAGGIIDGFSDGLIEGIGEAGAQNVVSGGNRLAARLVRAPVDALVAQRSSNLFETAARGIRNPYGLTADPSGRLWFTDNGATNVPDHISAGDEVNLFDPRAATPGTPEDATPYYGFPLALNGAPPDWYTAPVVDLRNSAAPTAITWAYGTIFFGVYGTDPGLYRLGRAGDGQLVAERILLTWPLLAVTTAPDGALWLGTGGGGLFRLTPGC